MQFGSLIIYKIYDWWNVKQANTKQKTEEQSGKANRFKGGEVKIQIPEEQAKKMQAMIVNKNIKHLTGNVQGNVLNMRHHVQRDKEWTQHCKYWQQTRPQHTGVTIRAGGERRKTGSVK